MAESNRREIAEPPFGAACEISHPFTRRLLRALPDIFFRIDGSGRFLEYYTDSPTLLFIDPAIIVGSTIEQLLPHNVAAICLHSINEAIRTGEVHAIEYNLIIDSQPRDFESRQIALNSNEVISIVRDITSQKQAKEKLLQNERQYRMLMEHASDAIFITDLEGNFLAVNARGCELIGKIENELVGLSIEDVYPKDSIHIVKDHLRQLEHTKSFRVESIIERDGQKVYLEINAALMPDGRVQGIVRDFTQRQRAHEAIQKSEKWFRLLIEQLPSLIAVHRDKKIVWANDATVNALGTTRDKLIGRAALDIVHPDDRAIAAARMMRQRQTGRPSPLLEERMVRDDGTVMHTELTAIPLEFEGEPSDIVIANDITERLKAENERQQLERRIQHAQKLQSLGVLAGGIAHDFNNLLMGVLGNASLALMDLPTTSPVRENLQHIELAARRAADLTRQLLAYAGKARFVTQPMCLSSAVQEMVQLLKTVVSKRASLRVDCAAGLPMIDADAMQLRQVIMNLITNASDALGENDGTITIRTSLREITDEELTGTLLGAHLRGGPYVTLEVSDSGVGMDTDTKERIFEPFFTTKSAGHGLGLAAVLGIVRGHRGAIQVYSEPGRGTCIKAFFPLTTSASCTSNNPDSTNSWTGYGTILIVDDDTTAQTTARQILQKKGFSVIVASDGLEALELYCQDTLGVSLVILDVTMPRMSGEETFRALRSVNANLRILLTSGFNAQEVYDRFAGKKLSGFIQKPYSASELVQQVALALGLSKDGPSA